MMKRLARKLGCAGCSKLLDKDQVMFDVFKYMKKLDVHGKWKWRVDGMIHLCEECFVYEKKWFEEEG